jgi:transposase-like protein
MGKNIFAAAHFHDEEAARVWFEAARWPDGPVCPHCGSLKHYATKKVGRYRCGEKECRKDFTVMTGSVMERSHAKLTQWAMAFYLGASSKKGFSAHQLHRALGCQYNTAWFLHHRVMEAMREGGLSPLGGTGKVVEADETYHGKVAVPRVSPQRRGAPYKYKRKGPRDKRAIVGLVERGGKVRMFHVAVADKESINKIIGENIAKESRFLSDESKLYGDAPGMFLEHETVKHSAGEYARYDDGFTIHTNTIEGVFSIFKRGMRGVYHHCSEKHLHRYLAEFDFRYNRRTALGVTDEERTVEAVRGGEGKRLTYHPTN